MTIDASILKNKTELSLKVNKAVVEYIKKNRVVDGKKMPVETIDLLNVAHTALGVENVEELEEEQRKAITSAVKKCITILEEVKAISPKNTEPKTLLEYIEFKKQQNQKQQKVINGKANSYVVSSDFSKKITALKTNELIQGCDVAEVELESGEVSVLIAKGLEYSKVKFCNSMFDYSKLAKYIGCYNEESKKIDFLATENKQKMFFATENKQRVLPSQREIINLYYLVNLSQYKTMFMPAVKKPASTKTILSLRSEIDKNILTTDNIHARAQIARSM